MNHRLGLYACRRLHWWSPRRRGKRTRAINIPGRIVAMAPKNIQMAAMDSPLFDYIVLHLVEEFFVAQKKCAYYQSGIQLSFKKLCSTNLWLTWIKCMVVKQSCKKWVLWFLQNSIFSKDFLPNLCSFPPFAIFTACKWC